LQAIWQLEDVMQQVRQLAYQLRPPNLESTTLDRALQALCAYRCSTGEQAYKPKVDMKHRIPPSRGILVLKMAPLENIQSLLAGQ
jgi:signal transduction histidine kinase